MFIRTRRLFLRPAWPEDAAAVLAGIGDWEIVRNLGRAPWPYTLADAQSYVARDQRNDSGADFLIFARGERPQLVGSIGFGWWLGPDHAPEIGYWIARKHWGRGYATEAGEAVLELAFEGYRLSLLAAGHFVDNPASGSVLRKLGFIETGEIVPYPCAARGAPTDSVEFLLRAEHWRARREQHREVA